MPTITVKTSYAPTGATPSNAELLLRIGDSDPTAWDEIVHRYGKLVYTTVRLFRLQDADALDAAQTTWLRLAEHVHQIQHPDRLAGWLVTTARRECLNILRQTKFTLFDAAAEIVTEPSAGPEQPIIDADTTRILWNFVNELSPANKPCCGHCSPPTPTRTPRHLVSLESRPAGSDPPEREPWPSFATSSNNTGSNPDRPVCSAERHRTGTATRRLPWCAAGRPAAAVRCTQ
jgi:RNA polymerase sigma factor (sigma-70 family)